MIILVLLCYVCVTSVRLCNNAVLHKLQYSCLAKDVFRQFQHLHHEKGKKISVQIGKVFPVKQRALPKPVFAIDVRCR